VSSSPCTPPWCTPGDENRGTGSREWGIPLPTSLLPSWLPAPDQGIFSAAPFGRGRGPKGAPPGFPRAAGREPVEHHLLTTESSCTGRYGPAPAPVWSGPSPPAVELPPPSPDPEFARLRVPQPRGRTVGGSPPLGREVVRSATLGSVVSVGVASLHARAPSRRRSASRWRLRDARRRFAHDLTPWRSGSTTAANPRRLPPSGLRR
jgi:hypothetical protein